MLKNVSHVKKMWQECKWNICFNVDSLEVFSSNFFGIEQREENNITGNSSRSDILTLLTLLSVDAKLNKEGSIIKQS